MLEPDCLSPYQDTRVRFAALQGGRAVPALCGQDARAPFTALHDRNHLNLFVDLVVPTLNPEPRPVRRRHREGGKQPPRHAETTGETSAAAAYQRRGVCRSRDGQRRWILHGGRGVL